MIPTLDDVKTARRYRFPANNKMLFLMDFRACKGIPNDRDFYFKRDIIDGIVELVARGYGIAGDYGLGPIYIKTNQLPESLDDSRVTAIEGGQKDGRNNVDKLDGSHF
jgi:hypothetical protein